MQDLLNCCAVASRAACNHLMSHTELFNTNSETAWIFVCVRTCLHTHTYIEKLWGKKRILQRHKGQKLEIRSLLYLFFVQFAAEFVHFLLHLAHKTLIIGHRWCIIIMNVVAVPLHHPTVMSCVVCIRICVRECARKSKSMWRVLYTGNLHTHARVQTISIKETWNTLPPKENPE